jgi:hypothetical protein
MNNATNWTIIDTDGMHLVVWGIGLTEAEARADAAEQPGYERTFHERVEPITQEQVESIEAGAVRWPFGR